MTEVHHRTELVDGQRVFYREAGPADAPVVLLLHGYPTSSRMFRNLIPALADRYHVIAPDHLGFGRSATPPVTGFTYTFDALTDVTETLLDRLGVERFAMYVQDYGAPSAGDSRCAGPPPSPRSSPRTATPTTRASSTPSGPPSGPTRKHPAPTPSLRCAPP